jgi:hypothetical protein
MSNITDDILQSDDRTDPRKWLDYLDGKLSTEEQNKLEEEIAQSEFLRDALEGLRPTDNDTVDANTTHLNAIVHQLNHQLRQQLAQKKSRRKRKSLLKHNPAEVAVILIIALCLIGYFLYRTLLHH